jgi:ankyrin repeat protein
VALTTEQAERVLALAADLARQGETAQLLEFLDHGVPVDVQDHGGNSLLMLAAYHGHPGTVAALLARGADPDLRNARDQSPVAGAVFKGEREVVRVLRDAGADLDAGTPSARAAAALFGVDL